MHLLHRSSMFGGGGGGGGKAPRRGAGSSSRAPLPTRQHLFSKGDSIRKRSATATAIKGSKRARLRAGLAAALQDLRIAARRHVRGSSPVPAAASAATPPARLGEPPVGLEVAACRAATASSSPEGAAASTSGRGGGALLQMLLLLALLCVVALGRAPAVCCCTCVALWCRGAL